MGDIPSLLVKGKKKKPSPQLPTIYISVSTLKI